MAPRDPRLERAVRRTFDQLAALGREIRTARLAAGLTMSQVARPAGISRYQIHRLENGQLRRFDARTVTRVLTVLGLELGVRAFLNGPPIRDAGHVRLLERIRQRLGPGWSWHLEVPVVHGSGGRAWDAVARLGGLAIAFEAETRLYDVQAQVRRIVAKLAAGDVDRVILVLADTRANREVLRHVRELLRADFPLDSRAVLAALAAGRDPGANGIVLI